MSRRDSTRNVGIPSRVEYDCLHKTLKIRYPAITADISHFTTKPHHKLLQITRNSTSEAIMREHEFFETHTISPSTRTDASSSATYLRALIENTPIPIFFLEAPTRHRMCNPPLQNV